MLYRALNMEEAARLPASLDDSANPVLFARPGHRIRSAEELENQFIAQVTTGSHTKNGVTSWTPNLGTAVTVAECWS